MMSEIRYYLPETRVVLSGVVEHTTTHYVEDDSPVTSARPLSTGISWQSVADQHFLASLSIDSGFLEDRLSSLTFTPDRRLASVSSSSTGAADGFIKAALKGAVAIAGIAGTLLVDRAAPKVTEAREAYDRDPAHQADSVRLAQLRAQLVTAKELVRQKRDALLQAGAGTPVSPAAFREINSAVALVGQIEQDLDQAIAAFEAWKESKTTRRSEQVEAILEMRQLPRWKEPSGLDWDAAASPATGELGAKDIWDRLGFVIARVSPSPQPSLAEADGKGVFVRMPRLVALALIRAGETPEAAHVEQVLHRWVMDDRSDVEFLPIERKLAGSQELTLGFDADGALIALSKSGKSGVAGVLNSVTEGVTEGLSTAKTAVETIDGFLNHDAAAKKARLEQDLATAKAEVELAGIGATRAEHAKVARLEQLANIAEQRTTIAKAGPGSIADLVSANPDLLGWYTPPAPSGPPEPQVVVLQIQQLPPPA